MKINVIGVPLNLGCDREGVERAPNHLRERGLMRIIRKNGHRAFDLCMFLWFRRRISLPEGGA